MVWRRRWIVVAALVAAIGGALVMTALQEPIYQAEAQMVVQPRSTQAVFDQDQTLNVANLDRAIETEIRVLEGERVRSRVEADLGLADQPPSVSATSVGSTDVVSVRVRSADPEVARTLADAYVQAYIAERRDAAVAELQAAAAELQRTIDSLQSQIDALEQGDPQRSTLISRQATFAAQLDQKQVEAALTTGGASVVKAAELPTSPVEPQAARTATLAAILGLLLGLGAALLTDYVDDSLRSSEDVEDSTGLPVLAVVPVEPPPDNRPIAITEPNEYAVEVYRGLRASVQFLGLDKPLKVIQVTSSLPGEGKTTTASNLAVVIAQAGHSVALVDADLRKPRIHEVFAVPHRPGLTDTLVASEAIDMAINHFANLHVVAAGSIAASPSEMLASGRFASLIADLSNRYDYIVVDTAPVLPVADALAVSRAVDGVLVVAEANRTSNRTLDNTLGRLRQVGAPVIGIVLNRAVERTTDGYGYGYGYGDSYRSPSADSVDDSLARRASDGPEAGPVERKLDRT